MPTRRSTRSSIPTCFILALLVGGAHASDDQTLPYVWGTPTLHLLWNDAYRLFPTTAFEGLREELETIFAANGIRLRVHRARKGQSLDAFPEPRVNAVLLPTEASSWKLHRDSMAAAVGEPGHPTSIFVFHPGVLRTLGHDGRKISPRRRSELARGMARVVAHELVHVLAPERRHASGGLMAETLTRKELTEKTIALDPETRRRLHTAIEAVTRAKGASAESGDDPVS